MAGSLQALLTRITHHPDVMGGRPCIRGMRITVSAILALLANDHTVEEILTEFPYLERDDIRAVLAFASWHAQEGEFPLRAS